MPVLRSRFENEPLEHAEFGMRRLSECIDAVASPVRNVASTISSATAKVLKVPEYYETLSYLRQHVKNERRAGDLPALTVNEVSLNLVGRVRTYPHADFIAMIGSNDYAIHIRIPIAQPRIGLSAWHHAVEVKHGDHHYVVQYSNGGDELDMGELLRDFDHKSKYYEMARVRRDLWAAFSKNWSKQPDKEGSEDKMHLLEVVTYADSEGKLSVNNASFADIRNRCDLLIGDSMGNTQKSKEFIKTPATRYIDVEAEAGRPFDPATVPTYDLLIYNCEHLANHITNGNVFSVQNLKIRKLVNSEVVLSASKRVDTLNGFVRRRSFTSDAEAEPNQAKEQRFGFYRDKKK